MKLTDIPQFTRCPGYRISVEWGLLTHAINRYLADGLDMDPDFQRGHVWTSEQQTAYVEYALRGGVSGREVYFNCPGWTAGRRRGFVLVDGKQRLTAVQGFLEDRVRAFGLLYSEFEDRLSGIDPCFFINVNDLPTRSQVLRWYLEMNTGGVVHTPEEIARVEALLKKEGASSAV